MQRNAGEGLKYHRVVTVGKCLSKCDVVSEKDKKRQLSPIRSKLSELGEEAEENEGRIM